MSDSGNHAEPTWFAHWPRLFIETLEVYAVFAVDLTGVILSWQPGVKRVLGYERENFVGQPSAIIFTEADQKAGVPEQELNTALQKGQALDERWHVHANGERFWGSGVTIAVRDNSDRVTGFAKLVRDRTSERLEDEVKDLTALRLEGSIVAQDEQIRLLAEDLTLAEQRERRRISQLLHDELQQQLYGLQMILGSVRGRATPDLAESLEEAYSLTKASVTLTRTFVSELDPHTLLGGAFDANLRWIASHMRERYSLEVTLEGEAYCPDLSKALSVLLLQCIQELLFNVVKHSGVKRADLTVEKTDTACTFTVHDKGRGFVMEPEDPNAPRQEVFGIQSVRRRLEPFGGTLQVNSKLGDGTQMTITLPNRQRTLLLKKFILSPGDEQALLQVVIVDDHPLIRSVLTRTLNHEPDLEVVSPVASAEAALETFAAAMPALMLVDYSMPGMNGAELIEQLKRTHPDLPQLVVLSWHTPAFIQKSLNAEAHGYVVKDDPSVLVNAISRVFAGELVIHDDSDF